MTTLIQPTEVIRDEYGYWSHPDLPIFAETDEATETSPKWTDWLKDQGLRLHIVDLEDEAEDHPAYVSYFEEGNGSIVGWHPTPPENEGWFTLAIFDTEDGPRAWFVRRNA